MDMDEDNSLFYLVSPQSSPTMKLNKSKYKTTNLRKNKSKSLFRLNEVDEDDYFHQSFQTLKRGTSQTLRRGASNAKNILSDAANKISLQLPSHKNLIQKMFPTDFSLKTEDNESKHEDFNQVWEQVYIHVYKLKDSDLGFYHTGIELHGLEFTYCVDRGIVRHRPRRCDWGHFLGSIRLGEVCLSKEQLEELLETMNKDGFSRTDYDVMENSCNVFTEALAMRLGLTDHFPSAVHNQTKLGAMCAPLIRALEIVTDKSTFNPNFLQPSTTDPDSGHASISPNNSVVSSPKANKRKSKSKLFPRSINESMIDLRRSSSPELESLTPMKPNNRRKSSGNSFLPDIPQHSGRGSFLTRSASFTPNSFQSTKYRF